MNKPWMKFLMPLPVFNAEGEGGRGNVSGDEPPATPPAAGGEGEGAQTGETPPPATGEPPKEGEPKAGDTPPAKSGSLLDDDPPKGEGEGEAGEPVTFDQLEFPEGFEVADDMRDSLMEIINDQSLSRKEVVEKLAGLQSNASAAAAESFVQDLQTQWQETLGEWEAQSRALPELGGEKFDETMATIKSGLKRVGASSEFYEALRNTGAGTHPEFIKVFHALTKPLKETPPAAGNPNPAKVSSGTFSYPSMEKNNG